VAVTLNPARAEIGIFHHDVELEVSAEMGSGVEVALLVTGPLSNLNLRKKERVWGLFWAPAEDVTFENVPGLYLLWTSTELENLAPEPLLEELGLGYEALQASLEESGAEDIFPELIRLKESESLFVISSGGGGQANRRGDAPVTAAVRIPTRAAPTTYTVQLFGFRDGRLVARGEKDFELTQTELIAFLTSLAHEHGLFYGILAVVVALGAGLGVGFLYGSAKKH
jgi:uncharacterized protein (TIGR02186 family)